MIEWDKTIWLTSYVLVFAGLSAFGAHRLKVLFHFWKHRDDPPEPRRRFEVLPRVTVQLPIFNEADVVVRLLDAVSRLDYPRELLQIQVLDDSTDDTAALSARLTDNLKARGYDAEFRHRTDRTGFKAGALDAAMPSAKGDFICIFDADFVPMPDMLQKMIHHFTDEKVGMVQARWGHINKNFSLLTRLQALFLDGHLVLEQTARSRQGEFLNFNGTAGIWRRATIEDAGGWQHDTLTEDLDLSYRAQLAGWRFIYLTDVVVPAELPPDMDGFKSQQHRWTKGSIQVCKKVLPAVWRSDIPLALKFEATAHLTSNFAYLLLLGVVILMYPANFVMGSSWLKVLLIDVPVFLFASLSVIIFYLVAQGAQTKRGWLKTIPYLPLLLALGVGMSINNGKAVLEALFNHQSDFIRTPKYGVQTKAQAAGKRFRYASAKSLCLYIEVALAVYFGWLTSMAAVRHQWGSIPFLAMFFIGFAYVAGGSLLKRLNLSAVPVSAGGADDGTGPALAAG
ncbi:MAG: glycosyltransferase family 2 protein [Verrucomicrobiaceae bacterium]|nr:glycosyltransferase family 2 protein [Verrucomicrobiaceae bacterium]